MTRAWYPIFMTNILQSDLFTVKEQPETLRPTATDDYIQEVAEDWKPLRPTAVFATYWYFAAERQRLFYHRLLGKAPPWTADAVLQDHRFTNAYRASDRVSQYLIRQILYPADQGVRYDTTDTLFRILLFKLFNRVETWQMLERLTGGITWQNYSFDCYDRQLTAGLERGERIFSAAYIMPSGQSSFGSPRKHRNCLRLLEQIVNDGGAEKLQACGSLQDVFLLLRTYPLLGDFLAFQFAIDINYSNLIDFEESTFVVAGPGARDGIDKCFSNAHVSSPERIIGLMVERQEKEFARLGIRFQSLWGRMLQPIDCQNLFCEVGKYARVAHPDVIGASGRTRIKQGFRSAGVKPLSPPYYPPKWGLNQKILASMVKHGIMPAS